MNASDVMWRFCLAQSRPPSTMSVVADQPEEPVLCVFDETITQTAIAPALRLGDRGAFRPGTPG
jgi:hypothetical protein